ncbi:MAG: prepilin-type N-terminal cleavage/methylation domain-containing protein [Phycisphaerales bacterium]|nr:prepilin-type N-terminal cleavage/methylation domain-containing protein [Phycisphaerales bacterium]
MKNQVVPRKRAFTLIEVLLALALGMVLSVAILGFFRDLILHRTQINERLDQERAAQALIENLSLELTCAIVGIEQIGSGLIGDEQNIAVMSRSVSVEQLVPGQDMLGDLTELKFHFDPTESKLEGGRRLVEVGVQSDSTGYLNTISNKLGWVRFRYLDKGRWRSSYDSAQQQRLPAAVEVAIWYVTPRAMEDQVSDSPADFLEEPLIEESDPDRIRIISIPDAMVATGRDHHQLD